MTKFFLVLFIAKIRKVINCLFVGDEVEQSQELSVDAARCIHESPFAYMKVRLLKRCVCVYYYFYTALDIEVDP